MQLTVRPLPSRDLIRFMGNGLVVGVAYVDPGNWGTDIAAGSYFGYTLLWVVAMSNGMGILLQYLAAKLGLATGRSLAENCRIHFVRPVSLFLWGTAEVAAIGTDLAEVLGAAIALNLLFGIPLLYGAILTGLDVFLILGLQRWGHRKLEGAIIAMVATVGLVYLYEIYLAQPDWSAIAYHSVVPALPAGSILVAVGILGATVMPHAIFLHSAMIKTRLNNHNGVRRERLVRLALADTTTALVMAGLINGAILVMAAGTFHAQAMPIGSIEEAHKTLVPALGALSSLAFAVALLASGLSSSAVATLAGQVIFEGFLNVKMKLWVRRLMTRLITLIPAILAIARGVDPLQLLVISQVTLSLQLPFTIVPLLLFTGKGAIMGDSVNARRTRWLAWAVAGLIILMNALLLQRVAAALL